MTSRWRPKAAQRKKITFKHVADGWTGKPWMVLSEWAEDREIDQWPVEVSV